MAYSTTAPLSLLVDSAMTGQRIYSYSSSHTSTEILPAGFFTGVGAGGKGLQNLGLKLGDLVINRASTDAAIPGRVTMHSVVSATADQASTASATGYSAAYNVTVASAT